MSRNVQLSCLALALTCLTPACGEAPAEAPGGRGERALTFVQPPRPKQPRFLDVNCDGYADLAVGSSGASAAAERVQIYHGKASGFDSVPSTTLSAPAGAGSYYGAVADAGDVNNDGCSDLIVGANYAGPSQKGEAYLYLGSPAGLAKIPTQTLQGAGLGALAFGFSVAKAGDINKDGYGDVIVSAVATNNQRGLVFVFLGNIRGLDLAPSYKLSGTNEVANFGYALAAGDLNRDGHVDLVISENRSFNWGTPGVGRVHVFLGTPGGISTTPARVLTCPCGAGMGFGVSLAVVGDVNGDGPPDLLVGAYGPANNTGAAYLYRGGAGGVSPTPMTLRPPRGSVGGYFGWEVAGGRDLNADGYADFVIGETDALQLAGRAHVYYGPTPISPFPLVVTGPDQTISGTHSGPGFFGNALSLLGDSNGDGLDDLACGAPAVNNFMGRVYVFEGRKGSLAAAPTTVIDGPNGSGASFGAHLAR